MAKFLASLMGIMSTRKYLSEAGIITLYAGGCSHTLQIALPGTTVWCLVLLQTEDLYTDFWRPRMLMGLFIVIGLSNIENIGA